MENKQVDILDVLLILAKHKKFIFWTTLIVSIAAVVYSLVTPEIWSSTAVILPYQNEASSLPFSSILGGIGSTFLSGVQEGSVELMTIMHSRNFSESIIKKFNLIEYFEIEEPDSLRAKDLALASLLEIVSIYLNDESGTISINVRTYDKELSSRIANYYVEHVDFVNREIRVNKSRNNREFLEKRVHDIEMKNDSLLIKLNNFQSINNVIHIEEQTKAAIQSYTELVSEKTKIEIQFDFHKLNANDNSQITKDLRKQIDIIEKKILAIEQDNDLLNPEYLLSLDKISELSVEYAKIEMQIKILGKIYEFIVPEYEAARIEEIRNLPAIEVIDKARPSGFRTSPKRARICVIAFLIGFSFSSLLVIIKSSLTENQIKKLDQTVSLIFRKQS